MYESINIKLISIRQFTDQSDKTSAFDKWTALTHFPLCLSLLMEWQARLLIQRHCSSFRQSGKLPCFWHWQHCWGQWKHQQVQCFAAQWNRQKAVKCTGDGLIARESVAVEWFVLHQWMNRRRTRNLSFECLHDPSETTIFLACSHCFSRWPHPTLGLCTSLSPNTDFGHPQSQSQPVPEYLNQEI